MHQFNLVLQSATATLLAFTALALMTSLKQGKHLWAGIGFTLCIFCYLILEASFVQTTFLRVIVLTGSIWAPIFLLLLSKSIFEDQFTLTPAVGLWFLLQTTPHVHHYMNCGFGMSTVLMTVFDILAQVISLGFVLRPFMWPSKQGGLISLCSSCLSASRGELAWTVVIEPSWPVFMACSMSSASSPRHSPTMIRSGRMRSALLTRSRCRISPLPSMLGGPRFQPDDVLLLQLQFGGVFDGDHALLVGNEVAIDV